MDYLNEYKTKGYFIIENMYNDKEINEMISLINNVKLSNKTETITRDKNNNILRLENILHNNEVLKKKIEKKEILDILNKCIESDVILFKDKIIYKNPGNENSLVPHVDGLFKSYNYRLKKNTFGWYNYSSKFINLTIMLTNNTIENGCIHINNIKSNDINFIYKNYIINNQNNKIDMNKVNDKFIPIIGKKGSIFVFNPLCIHYSLNNFSDKIRRNIYLTYNDKKDGDNYMLNLNDKILAINNKGLSNIEKLSSGNDFFNVMIIGFGNIGYRYLQALLELKYYSLNIIIVSNKDPNLKNIKYKYYNNIQEVNINSLSIVIISTCSNVRLNIINSLINNINIKKINYLILEKVVFTNIEEYTNFNNLNYGEKINNIYITSYWEHCLQLEELLLFSKPKVNIISNKEFGICCNLIHILIYFKNLIQIKNNNIISYEIIPAKRENYNELIFKLKSDFLNIEQINNNSTKPFLSIKLEENDNKLEYNLLDNNNYLINYYRKNILINSYKKKIINVSEYLINQFNNMLIEKNDIKLCDNNTSYNSHYKLFSLFQKIKDLKIT